MPGLERDVLSLEQTVETLQRIVNALMVRIEALEKQQRPVNAQSRTYLRTDPR